VLEKPNQTIDLSEYIGCYGWTWIKATGLYTA